MYITNSQLKPVLSLVMLILLLSGCNHEQTDDTSSKETDNGGVIEDNPNNRNPPADDTPVSEPPVQNPPQEEPPANDPPAADPQDPPQEEPPVSDPPSEDPPVQNPPDEETPPDEGQPPMLDSDNDGVVDIEDDYPNEPTQAYAYTEPFDIGVTYAQELIVAENGNDENADGSVNFPYASIRAAARDAVPGTRIRVSAGTYGPQGFIANLQGNANQPIAIMGDGQVIFDAAGQSHILQLSDPRYVVLEGFTVQNAAGNGLNIDDGGSYDTPAEYVVVRNVHIRNIGATNNNDCLKMSGVDHFFVLDSEFENCDAGMDSRGSGSAIDMVGCHKGVVDGNYFHDMPANAVQAKGGSADVYIHANRFSDVHGRAINAGGSTDDQYYRPIDAPYDGARIRMVANIFERGGEDSGAPVSFVGCDHCVFANNTIIEPNTWVVRILQERDEERFVPSRFGYFINNIIVFNTSDLRTFVNVGGGTAAETFTFDNNLWFAVDNVNFSGPNYPSGIVPASHSIVQQNPQFDLENGIYNISINNPAARQGREVPGVADKDFENQLYSSPRDLGAFIAQ